MSIVLKHATSTTAKDTLVVVATAKEALKDLGLSKDETAYIKATLKKEPFAVVNQYSRLVFVTNINKAKAGNVLETYRKTGFDIHEVVQKHQVAQVAVVNRSDASYALAITEGMALSNYQFLKYFKDKKGKTNALKTIKVKGVDKKTVEELQVVVDATLEARTLINEPLSYLTAPQLAKEIKRLGKTAGFKVEVFNKAKIEALKMGGLLAVNKGSIDPPTFSILEWKPKNATNKKPYVLVGKGVVYDTGGLSLKPTPNSMDQMKCDMGGAAAMIGAMYAVAKNKLPIHLIALIPATDNRPGQNAYAPGDVIKMHSGLTVEVLNTDAEGRMLLADALSYAQKYKPELVIDAATLTGSAMRAIGQYGIVAMGNAKKETFDALRNSGTNVYERIVEFPFWEEYGEEIKSDIADIKNLGGPNAGAITAGKFLAHFTNYPWIHLDIAGPAFLTTEDSYRGKGGVGVGVRLLFDFLKNKSQS